MAGGVSMIGGLTHITGTGFFARIQTCDWLFLQSIAAGTTGIGIPVSILGNNFAFRRETYELTGGFESMGFSLTEDMALLQAFKRIHGVAIAYPLSHGTLVQSEAVGSVSDLIHQRLRWVAGGRRSGIWGWLLMIVTFLLHLLLPVVLLISTGNIFLLIITGAIFLADFSLLAAASSRLGSRIPLFYFPAFEVYYFLYTTVIGFLSLLPMKIRWKGREYK
jgi:cellulose synthase/poly-beta-1,6-N-acetylglucosamine synthase-like glycosyltransferase